MEILVGGLILSNVAVVVAAYLQQRGLLNAIVAKTPQEFMKLQDPPKRKVKKEVLQDDAGIPFGL